ncbi:hypothetical protein DFP72DRAFT_773469, partial [Ephemerocybe angulata]
KMEARHHFVAETNTKYDYILHNEKKPRDTIPRLRKPGSEPPQYATSTNEMVEIATKHHEDLQGEYVHEPGSAAAETAKRRALNSLKPRLGARERTRLGRRIRGKDVERAVNDIANGKASGLDGIPIEVWKMLAKEYKTETSKSDEGKPFKSTANIIAIITTVLNDVVRHGVATDTDFAEGW